MGKLFNLLTPKRMCDSEESEGSKNSVNKYLQLGMHLEYICSKMLVLGNTSLKAVTNVYILF